MKNSAITPISKSAAIEDRYALQFFKSIDFIDLPTLYICNAQLLPLLLPALAKAINRLQKRQKGGGVESRINLNLLLKFGGFFCRVQYNSHKKNFGKPTPLELENPDLSTQENESEEVQEDDD